MKKWKIALLAFLVIVLAVASYVMYELKFKKYDIADEQVSAIIDKAIEIKLPDGQVVAIDKDGNISESKAVEYNTLSNSQTNNETTSKPNTQSPGKLESNSTNAKNPNQSSNLNNSGNANEQSPITVNKIKEKYERAFQGLESESRNRLNSLIEQAKNEYSTKKINGEKISYGYFYRKYTSAAASMEKSTDEAMIVLLNFIEVELQQNNFDKSHAQSFKKQYESTKEKLRNEIMKKVISF